MNEQKKGPNPITPLITSAVCWYETWSGCLSILWGEKKKIKSLLLLH